MRRALLAAFAALLIAAPAAAAEPVSLCNVPIRMSDGIVLRANVFLPDRGGRYPVALTATGYNKDTGLPPGGTCSPSSGIAAANPKLLESGYAVMILDDRGTGASQGRWDSWGERTQRDYGEVLDWIQRQGWSNGKVGTNGGSYMAITSLLIAEKDVERVAAGKPRVVQAVWANVPMADAYRDVTFHGGSLDSGFMPLWLGLVNGLSDLPPSTLATEPEDAVPTWLDHVAGNAEFAVTKVLGASLGSDDAYDGPFYRTRSPVERIRKLTIPVAWTGGWWDIFQRGEPLLYEEMQSSRQRKFWMTPMYHASDDGGAWDQLGIGSPNDVHVRWFDRWLKGERNGVEDLPPVNLYTMGSNRWRHERRWPVPGTEYTPLYLGAERDLRDAPPAEGGGDDAPLLPLSSPCSRLSAQWTAGLVALGQCETDNRTFEATALTYTTPPLERDTEVTGLITARLWASLTSRDATLVAVLSDVAPSGESTQVTAGFLLASQRAVDERRSTRSPDGEIVRPWHPFTRESQKPVPEGEPQEYLIEIYPTSNTFKAGHRLRLTIASANTPTTMPPLPTLLQQAGGEIRLLHGPEYPSSVLLPIVP